MKISREDWERVMEKACDIANTTEHDRDPMHTVHVEGMMKLLDELEDIYGPQSQILATRADYLNEFSERRALYQKALLLALKNHDTREINEITNSLKDLAKEEQDLN